MSRRTVRIARNSAENLADIRRFLEEQEAPREFRSLLEQLFETVIPNPERFPEMGVDFLAKVHQATEGLMRLETLKQRLGKNTGLREYISGDYPVL